MTKQRVVITGMGMVSPLGHSVAETWKALIQGHSGVTAAEFPGVMLSENASKVCASVKNFDPSICIHPKIARKTDLFIQYGLVAAHEALQQSGLLSDELDRDRVGVAVGSGIGGLPLIQSSHEYLIENDMRKVSPSFITGVIINMLSGHISIEHGFRGPNLAVVTACTTGTHNIGLAARAIAYGDADVMVAGGAEMATCALGFLGFNAMRAMSTRNDAPEKASRPWDQDRDGFILGEGAGVLILESEAHAKKRGATILAELVGFGMSADASHMTLPDQTAGGASLSMRRAIQDAAIDLDLIDHINAHATSTPAGDEIEALAVRTVFGKHAPNIAISGTKSMTGHLLGAAGAVEAIFTIQALLDGIVPPTINLDRPAESVLGLNLVPHHAQEKRLRYAMSNSFGFGGTNGTIIFKNFEN